MSLRALFTKTAWWAPAAVLVLHKAVMLLGLRSRSDALLHFSGGVAITAFLWSLIPLLASTFGTPTRPGRATLAFCGGCTVALLWEIAEFASDEFLGTRVQHSLRETMLDLTCGTAGALLLAALFSLRQSPKAEL